MIFKMLSCEFFFYKLKLETNSKKINHHFFSHLVSLTFSNICWLYPNLHLPLKLYTSLLNYSLKDAVALNENFTNLLKIDHTHLMKKNEERVCFSNLSFNKIM